jgi:hypothetical protein
MTSTIKYYKCEEIFAELPLWKAVPDVERKGGLFFLFVDFINIFLYPFL